MRIWEPFIDTVFGSFYDAAHFEEKILLGSTLFAANRNMIKRGKELLVPAVKSTGGAAGQEICMTARAAVREDKPPKVTKPLYQKDIKPTQAETKIIQEMYEWERQSSRVQFKMK